MIRKTAYGKGFSPKEVLFSTTSQCNLSCGHCSVERGSTRLSVRHAAMFLASCKKAGVERVGFTGGEPFLYPEFLIALTRETLRHKLLFGRIMTNAVWWKDAFRMRRILGRLHEAGFDGTICVSVDAFHRQDITRVGLFIDSAIGIWNRPDIIEIASVVGARDKETLHKLERLARALGGRLNGKLPGHVFLKGDSFFIRVTPVWFSAPPSHRSSKAAWDGRWFREDRCAGPGNVFFVESCGTIKPCCGYANDLEALSIGKVGIDGAASAIKSARNNRFVRTVFASGLTAIRRRLIRQGISLPGKTTDHCFFCRYISTKIPRQAVTACLN